MTRSRTACKSFPRQHAASAPVMAMELAGVAGIMKGGEHPVCGCRFKFHVSFCKWK
jgi:hypothetical protein